jgi:hypothetical protein
MRGAVGQHHIENTWANINEGCRHNVSVDGANMVLRTEYKNANCQIRLSILQVVLKGDVPSQATTHLSRRKEPTEYRVQLLSIINAPVTTIQIWHGGDVYHSVRSIFIKYTLSSADFGAAQLWLLRPPFKMSQAYFVRVERLRTFTTKYNPAWISIFRILSTAAKFCANSSRWHAPPNLGDFWAPGLIQPLPHFPIST